MNTKQLREVINQEITDLVSGNSTNARAGSVARLAKATIEAKRLELQVSKHRIEHDDEKTVEL